MYPGRYITWVFNYGRAIVQVKLNDGKAIFMLNSKILFNYRLSTVTVSSYTAKKLCSIKNLRNSILIKTIRITRPSSLHYDVSKKRGPKKRRKPHKNLI